MMKNNKVLNAVMLPKVLSLAVLISLVAGASVYISQEKTPETAHTPNKNICLLGLVALLVICASADIYSDYKRNENFSSLVVRKYLKKELKKHPELKLFEKNLDNPQVMQNISALVFNSLRSSEKKRVMQVILEMRQNLRDSEKYGTEDTEPLKTTKALFNDARNKIITIMQEHASVHPEFITDIYSAMARTDMIYMMQKNSNKQITR